MLYTKKRITTFLLQLQCYNYLQGDVLTNSRSDTSRQFYFCSYFRSSASGQNDGKHALTSKTECRFLPSSNLFLSIDFVSANAN